MRRQKPKNAGSQHIARRDVLRLGATAAAGVAFGPFVVTPARAQAFNWQRFKGKELFLLLYKHPFVDEMVKHIPEFESLTGIKAKYEVLPEVQGRQKLASVRGEDVDVYGFHLAGGNAAVAILLMRGGQLLDRRELFWEGEGGVEPARLLGRAPLLRRIPARLVGLGIRPEHVSEALRG